MATMEPFVADTEVMFVATMEEVVGTALILATAAIMRRLKACLSKCILTLCLFGGKLMKRGNEKVKLSFFASKHDFYF